MNQGNFFIFSEHVKSVFAFLKEFNFDVVYASLLKVRYESKDVYIEINHGEWDREVFITFGRIAKDEEFSFTLFLRLVNALMEKSPGERLADQPDEVCDCLTKRAKAMQKEGQSIMKGDNAVFEKMKDVRWWDFQPDALKERFRKQG